MNIGIRLIVGLVAGAAVGVAAGFVGGMLMNADQDTTARIITGAAGGLGAMAAVLVMRSGPKRA